MWGDFGNPDAEVWEENNIDTLPAPDTGVLGIGSPFYERTVSSFCLGIAADRPFSKINGGWIRSPGTLDGRILLNSNVSDYSGGDFTYLINSVDNPSTPTQSQFDLHSIFLHELLHVLGIASRIDPSLNGSSRYDLELRVQDDAGINSPLVIPNPTEPGCYTYHPDINDFLFNDCNDDLSIGFLASDEIAMQSGGFPIERIGNGFSHFVNICGETVNYVMGPGLSPGQSVRTISAEEQAIFCAMGYQTPSIDCEGCFVMGISNNNGRLAIADPCSFIPNICAGDSTTLSLSELTRIHTNSENFEWGEPIVLIENGDDLVDSTIEIDINGDMITIFVSPNSHGDMLVQFPVTACDNGETTVLNHAFFVNAVCDDCSDIQETICGNISCSTDFENYPRTNSFISLGEITRQINRDALGLPRLGFSTSPPNNHVYLFTRTPLTIELLNPILPGCEVTIGFDAVFSGNSGLLDFWGSQVRMCSANEIPVGVPADCNDLGTDCGDDVFVPYCLGQSNDVTGGADTYNRNRVFESPPPFEPYTFTFSNDSESPLNFIYVLVSPENPNTTRGFYLDNIEVTTRCPINIETTQISSNILCRSTSELLSFEICNNATESVSLSLGINNLPGWEFSISDDNFEILGNSCSTVTFNALPNAEINEGDHSIALTLNAENQCGAVESLTEQFTVSVTECNDSPFTCACEGTNAINLDAGDGTLLSQFIALGEITPNSIFKKCLAISGNLFIDEAAMGSNGFYNINSSEVRMQPGAHIIIESGAALSVGFSTNGGIHGCENLWHGISLAPQTTNRPGGRLKLTGARIEDAVHAVSLSNGSSFEMIYSTLNRNHIGIYKRPALTPGTEVVFQPTPIHYSSIQASGDLLPPYLGQEVQTTGKSYAGVEINDCKKFQIGASNIGINITGANYGVIARGSNVSIVSSSIYNTIPSLDASGGDVGILAESNSWIGLRNSRLYDMEHGILGNQSSLDCRNNIIGENSSGDRGNIKTGISLGMSIGHTASITNQNRIYSRKFGILISNAQHANKLFIENNTVELYPPEPGLEISPIFTSAIRLEDAMMSGENLDNLNLTGNTINLRRFGNGIALHNVNGVTIANNQVNFLPTYSEIHSGSGLFLRSSSDNYLYGNLVSGNGLSHKEIAITVDSGDRNVLCCNNVEDAEFGAIFFGICDETKLRHNTFKDNLIGLILSQGARIGPQIAAGNAWSESVWNDAMHLSEDGFNVAQSRFFVIPPEGTPVWPEDIFVAASTTEWFVPGQESLVCEDDADNCERPSLNRLAADNEFTQKVLQDNFIYGNFPETSDWEAKRVFYRSQQATKSEERSQWSTIGLAFSEQQKNQNTTLHRLTKIEQLLEVAMTADPLVTEATSNLGLLNDQLFNLDQTLEEGEEPSNQYLMDRASLLTQQAEAFTELTSLLDQKQHDFQDLIAQLNRDNEKTLTSIDASTATKSVNRLYFATVGAGMKNLPTAAASALRKIAESCPEQFGSAVGRSQSILIHYEKPFEPSKECSGGKKEELKSHYDTYIEKTDLLDENLNTKDVHIYPNPATGQFTIQVPQNESSVKWKVDLFNARGQTLQTHTIQGSQLQMDASELSSGVYWLRLQFEGQSISKRVVIK
ncbi:T9SS type A sorting domain-containing protein [Neolewinella agarilytica]|uniref:T9SS type A sorting domain-containing protein n=2 Tax=Neolewinella agarilytica TaxID=478744 RepID=UPI0023528F81|nr:T9SS type A sorting domain-containing protein [Neolewinella agarilytica]